ncbi:hypothetical protein L3K73_11650 [Holdemanella sp. SCCA2]|nr:hypothetical protein [Holdemanella sp. SCCA2]
MVPGQGFIVVGNKTQKNTICIFIEKQNRTSDTRGETIRHNMQKKHLHICQTCQKLTLPPVGESAILVKHEKMRAGLSVQPGKAKKDNDKVSCFAQGGSGGTAGQKRKA